MQNSEFKSTGTPGKTKAELELGTLSSAGPHTEHH
jgi:hypothetical protein